MSQHYISIDPSIMGGRACINHSRIPVTTLANFYLAGNTIADIADNYDVVCNDVLVAIWYLGMHGTRKHKKLWGAWAKASHGAICRGEWDKVPDPPREGKKGAQ